VKFIEANKEKPFFLYVPHSMPHVPLFVLEKNAGKSPEGLFGDVIQEIDGSVGQILAALDRHQLAQHTLVVFTSDNGPWLSYGHHAGSAGPLREGKGTAFEGGVRVPCVMRLPGTIPAGSECAEPLMTIDLLPTIAKLTGAELPKLPVDGLDASACLTGDTKSPHEALYFYWGGELEAVRSGPWKLHFRHAYRSLETPGQDGEPGKYVQKTIEESLFNLDDDIGETKNVAGEHPDIVAKLKALADKAREDLGDTATRRQGKGVRPAGKL
jgi:arylsulfatase A-like enzyme